MALVHKWASNEIMHSFMIGKVGEDQHHNHFDQKSSIGVMSGNSNNRMKGKARKGTKSTPTFEDDNFIAARHLIDFVLKQ
jgi:hypothetical protein